MSAWGWYNQCCGHEDHGYATRELADAGADRHMQTCEGADENRTHPPALYVEYFSERLDDSGEWIREEA